MKDKIMDNNSFILTMWYVNKWENRGKSIFDTSFILTMWYVNK